MYNNDCFVVTAYLCCHVMTICVQYLVCKCIVYEAKCLTHHPQLLSYITMINNAKNQISGIIIYKIDLAKHSLDKCGFNLQIIDLTNMFSCGPINMKFAQLAPKTDRSSRFHSQGHVGRGQKIMKMQYQATELRVLSFNEQ